MKELEIVRFYEDLKTLHLITHGKQHDHNKMITTLQSNINNLTTTMVNSPSSWTIYEDRGQLRGPQSIHIGLELQCHFRPCRGGFTTTVVCLFILISLGSYIQVSRRCNLIFFCSLLSCYEFKRTLRTFESCEEWTTPLGRIMTIVLTYWYVYVYLI